MLEKCDATYVKQEQDCRDALRIKADSLRWRTIFIISWLYTHIWTHVISRKKQDCVRKTKVWVNLIL